MSPTDWFHSLTPVSQALVAALFTWGVTAVGAAVVFLVTDVQPLLPYASPLPPAP